MTKGRKKCRALALDSLDRTFDIATAALSPGGLRALWTWRPRSAAAFRITMGIESSGVTPATVIDVGANVGQFSRASLGRWPTSTIIAFEPLACAAEPLRRMLAAMGRRHAVYQMALGSTTGESLFRQHRYSLSSSVLPVDERSRDRYWAEEGTSITVPMARLDDVLSDVALDHPVLIKVDVQGYEMEVLAGAAAVLDNADCLIVEHAFDDFYKGQARTAEVIDYLRMAGWDFSRVVDTRRERGVIVEADVVYLRRSTISGQEP